MNQTQHGVRGDRRRGVRVARLVRFAIAATVAIAIRAGAGPAPAAAVRQIPALHWAQRSDWSSVRHEGAVGDGRADDTASLQRALDHVEDGSTVYLPPGQYRITRTLNLRNPNGARWIGGLLIGCGRDTRLDWYGPAGGTMVRIDGIACSRIVGLELNGRGRAATGLHYKATQGFQTEVTHRHLAFRNFTDAAVLEDHKNSEQALAETTFENCLFDQCARGVALLQFNDYDYTFDGCEFRRCGVGLDCAHGNFYARDCHFEGSRIVDIRDWSEVGSSIRRCTSTGSNAFITRLTTVAPLTVQDCRVDSWQSREGAIVLSRPPALIFDCVFTHPPRGADNSAVAPVHVHSDGQRLIVSENRVEGGAGLFQPGAQPLVSAVPAGRRGGALQSAAQSFLKESTRIPRRVFDARTDFGAKADGTADDTTAVQRAVDAAARAGADSIAYLPAGSYVITRPLRISGRDFYVGGSGWATKLVWRGREGGTLVEVRDPQNVVLEEIMIGSHDAGAMNNGVDVDQTGAAGGSHMTYDGVYAYGMYQKQPERKGIRFTGLGAKDVVVVQHAQGNMRFAGCGAATIVANCTYEGSVVVDGTEGRGGLLGFQTRLATAVTHGLYLRDNQDIVMSDFYMESADNGFLFEGRRGQAPGRAVIQGAKVQFPASGDPAKNTALDIRGYQGDIYFGPDQFYGEPMKMRIRQTGSAPLELYLLGCSWYGTQPDVNLAGAGRLSVIGNEAYGTAANGEPLPDPAKFGAAPSQAAIAALSRGLDDLRRLGQWDLRLNHPRATGAKGK